MNVLIVDDSKVMRQIVNRTLRQAGIADLQTMEAEHGKHGLETVRANPQIDIVLSDWNMPEMTGIEFLRALRAEGNPITFGFVTSEGTPEMRITAAEAGAAFLISKPFTSDTFAAVFAQIESGAPVETALHAEAAPGVYTKKNILPVAAGINDFLNGMINRRVNTQPARPFTAKPGTYCVAEYLSDEGKLCVVAMADAAFAAFAGSALAMIPAMQAKQMVQANKVDEPVRGNAYEVFNVMAACFKTTGTPHVRLTRFFTPGQPIPPELNKCLDIRLSRQDFTVDIPMYGLGQLMIVVL